MPGRVRRMQSKVKSSETSPISPLKNLEIFQGYFEAAPDSCWDCTIDQIFFWTLPFVEPTELWVRIGQTPGIDPWHVLGKFFKASLVNNTQTFLILNPNYLSKGDIQVEKLKSSDCHSLFLRKPQCIPCSGLSTCHTSSGVFLAKLQQQKEPSRFL